ncbi:MAG: hypothetical protein ACOYMA_14970 [Bacteroidia bacterium]
MKILILEDDFTLSKEIKQKVFECAAVYEGNLVLNDCPIVTKTSIFLNMIYEIDINEETDKGKMF